MKNKTDLECSPPTTVPVHPLAAPVLTHLDDLARLGQRLQSALADAIQGLPVDIRSANRLPEGLGVDKSTCYRLWRASQVSPGRWNEVILSLPGPSAMRCFIAAIKRRRLSRGLIDSFQSAVDQFDAFVRDKYRSQTRLKEMLSRMPSVRMSAPTSESTPSSTRAALFHSAAALNRSSVDLDGAIVLVMPSQRPNCVVEVAMLIVYLGFRASPGGRPLIVHVGSQKEHPLAGAEAAEANAGLEIRDTDGDPLIGQSSHCIVPEFSSHPLPAIVRERSASREVARLCVDVSDATQVREGFDLVTAFRLDPIPHTPEQARAPFKGFLKTIDHPTSNLIVDVYLHRSFARRCIPEASCDAPVPTWMADSECARWAYRLPEYPDLRILPNDLAAAQDAAWPRYGPMATLLFDRCGVRRDEYVGHRMSTRYPLWPTSYKLAFDYD